MNPLEFARIVKDGSTVSDQDYIDLMRRVVPLDELRSLTPEEAEWFHGAVAWLYDFSILLLEFTQSEHGKRLEQSGVPWLPGPTGPFIHNILTREREVPPDFTLLETFGVERPDRSSPSFSGE